MSAFNYELDLFLFVDI